MGVECSSNVYLEKPGNWLFSFDGMAIAKSDSPVVLECKLPLEGFIDHWGQSYHFHGGISVKASALGNRNGLSLELHIEAWAKVPCARCLKDAPLDISRDLRYFYKPLSSDDPSFDAEGDQGIVIVESIESDIDISDQVWESLILSLPEKVLCSPDCKGICSVCGSDKNRIDCGCARDVLDPRFEMLAEEKLKDNCNVSEKGGNQSGSSQK